MVKRLDTSIMSIKAKPIIDIAITVDDFNDILAFEEKLKSEGFYYRPQKQILENLMVWDFINQQLQIHSTKFCNSAKVVSSAKKENFMKYSDLIWEIL